MLARIRTSRRGFTVVELLTVLAIIGTLAGLLVPFILQARETARRSICKNNLKQLGLAFDNYHLTHKVFPMGWQAAHPADKSGGGSWAWCVPLMPNLE